MKTVSAAKVAAQFNDYLEASRDQPVIVTRNGKPIAVLVSVQSREEAERISRSDPPSLRSVFQQSAEEFEEGLGIPKVEFWRQVARRRTSNRKPRARGKSAKPS